MSDSMDRRSFLRGAAAAASCAPALPLSRFAAAGWDAQSPEIIDGLEKVRRSDGPALVFQAIQTIRRDSFVVGLRNEATLFGRPVRFDHAVFAGPQLPTDDAGLVSVEFCPSDGFPIDMSEGVPIVDGTTLGVVAIHMHAHAKHGLRFKLFLNTHTGMVRILQPDGRIAFPEWERSD